MNVFDSLRHLKNIMCIVQAYVDGVNNKMFFCLALFGLSAYCCLYQHGTA